MQRWESISRRYKELSPEPRTSLTRSEVRQLGIWLEDDVVPFLVETTQLPRFRELATFSLRSLAAGSRSEVRQAVEAVDRSLSHMARTLICVAGHPGVRTRLDALISTDAQFSEGVIEIGTAGDRIMADFANIGTPPSRKSDDLPLLISVVERETQDLRADLVNPDDYFATRQEFVTASDGTHVQRGEMISSVNQRLLPIGDLISRSLRRRIDIRRGPINNLQVRLNRVLADPQLSNLDEVMVSQRAMTDLEVAASCLDAALFYHAEAILRDSCVALTQVYASLHPAPVLHWLGIRDELLHEARVTFPARLQGPRGGTIHDRIARAVEDMSTLYRGIDPSISHLQHAIASGGLVISDADQLVWWEGRQLDFGNGKKQKEFLIALARKASRNLPVSEADLYPRDVQSESTMANRWNRLGSLLPTSLSQRIGPGDHPRTYQLHLDRHQIFLF